MDDGSWAIAFLNVGGSPVNITCGVDCLAPTGWEGGQMLKVRDLWSHVDLPQRKASEGLTVANLEGDGGVVLFMVKPVWRN